MDTEAKWRSRWTAERLERSPLVSLEALPAGFSRSGRWRWRPSDSEPRVLREAGREWGGASSGSGGDPGGLPSGRSLWPRPATNVRAPARPWGAARRAGGAGRCLRAQEPFSPLSLIKQRPACWAARAPGPSLRGGMSGSPGPQREPSGWASLGGPGKVSAVRMRTDRYRYLL